MVTDLELPGPPGYQQWNGVGLPDPGLGLELGKDRVKWGTVWYNAIESNLHSTNALPRN